MRRRYSKSVKRSSPERRPLPPRIFILGIVWLLRNRRPPVSCQSFTVHTVSIVSRGKRKRRLNVSLVDAMALNAGISLIVDRFKCVLETPPTIIKSKENPFLLMTYRSSIFFLTISTFFILFIHLSISLFLLTKTKRYDLISCFISLRSFFYFFLFSSRSSPSPEKLLPSFTILLTAYKGRNWKKKKWKQKENDYPGNIFVRRGS